MEKGWWLIASVVLDGVTLRLGETLVLDRVSLDVADGELMAIVGPSGSGKTSILRSVAGLDIVEDGSVLIGGRDVTRVETRDRDVSMVFQEATLYPKMRARANVGFPLSVRDVPKEEIEQRVAAEGRALEIEEILNRWPRQLSAGHQHLVQIARAMIRVPSVFLLDEPLARIDTALRQKLRVDLRFLQRGYGVTTIYVTNDSVEAMAMGDRVAVIDNGRVQQVGEPLEVYARPASTFVASLLGDRPINLLAARIEADEQGGAWVSGEGFRVRAWSPAIAAHGGEMVSLGVRPENIEPDPAGEAEAVIDRVVAHGSHYETIANIGGERVWMRTAEAIERSERLRVHFRRWHVFDRAGRAIAHVD